MTALESNVEFYQELQQAHDEKLKREEHIEKFFSAKQLRTADAILWESGIELTLTPKD